MADYDMSIHQNPDAVAWAKFFMECYADYKTPLDEEIMTTWFANAMMAMHDHIKGIKIEPLPDGSAFVVG